MSGAKRRMIGPSLAIVLLLGPGCLGGADDGPETPATPDPFEGYEAAGAKTIETLESGDLRLEFEGVMDGGPATVDFFVPNGTTYVDVTARVAPQEVVRVGVSTDHPHANFPPCGGDLPTSLLEQFNPVSTCRGLATFDAGYDWHAHVSVPANPYTTAFLGHAYLEPVPFTLEVVMSAAPLDGLAADINLDALSKPVHGMQDVQVVKVPSTHDGVLLNVEYWLPDAEGPFPSIIVSTPYSVFERLNGVNPYSWLARDIVPRGYALVVADVRGNGRSEGCASIWAIEEQRDQYDLVEWTAAQSWSDGKVGFWGVSYMGATAAAAATLAPPHLTTSVMIAPGISLWDYMGFHGVPDGRGSYEIALYLALFGGASIPEEEAPWRSAIYATGAACDPMVLAETWDQRGLYTPPLAERNVSINTHQVKVPTLFTQGFYDDDIYPTSIPHFFNDLPSPKKGIFGPWRHNIPGRADYNLFQRAWFDHWLMDRPTGVMEGPEMEVHTVDGRLRTGDAWPDPDVDWRTMALTPGAILSDETAPSGSERYRTAPYTTPPTDAVPERLTYTSEPVDAPILISGEPRVRVDASVEGAHNTYFHATLYDVDPDGERRVVHLGMANAAQRESHSRYEPVTPGAVETYSIKLFPIEYYLETGHRLELVLRGAGVQDWTRPAVGGVVEPALVTIHYGDSALRLPTLPAELAKEPPRSART